MPCERCGASLERERVHEHFCDEGRWLDYELFQRREDIERFEDELDLWLESPAGRFERFYAERERRRSSYTTFNDR